LITTNYNIGISEIICTERLVSFDGLSIKYVAESSSRPNKCTNPKCLHDIKPHIHSSKHNAIKDIKSEGKIVIIDLKIYRYRCPDCGYVFPDEFTFFEKNAHITNRLKQEFVNRCIKGETFLYIANDYSVADKTVARAFNDYADEHRDEYTLTYTPVVLGIDEAHIDDHFRLVLTDINNKKLLDIRRNNKMATVKSYLRTLDKNVCQCVTMDFASGYASAVKAVLPDATIVIDKFHVIQLINRTVDSVRVEIQNYYRSQGHNIRVFKNAKRLFMSNFEDLSDEATNQLQNWFDAFPNLYNAYMVKESFRDIYATAKSYGEACKMFNEWIEMLPDTPKFRTLRYTFTERKEHILNYFIYKHTNAYTESVNNSIKKIEKAGRGYKFDVLRDRCMLSINNPAPDKFSHKDALYFKDDEAATYRKKLERYKKLVAQMEERAMQNKGLIGNSPNNPVLIEIYDKLPSLSALRRNVFKVADDVKKV